MKQKITKLTPLTSHWASAPCLGVSVAITVFVLALACVVAPLPVAAQQGTTRYVYDENGRLRAVISPTGEAAIYEYDAAGNFTAIRRLGVDALEILDFFPREGVPGDRVTFIGVGFSTGATAVAFNGAAAEIVETSSTVVVARVPEAATTGPVAITVPRGTVMTPALFVVRGVRVSPSSVTVVSGDSVQFTAAVTIEGDRSVRWSVNGIDGGSSAVGTISATGLYTAPNLPAGVPTLTFIIRATSIAVPAVFGEARVTVRNPEFLRNVWAAAVSVRNGGLTTISPTTSAISVRNGNLTEVATIAGAVSVRNGSTTTFSVLSAGVSATMGPNISTISPDRVARGATVSVTINGANLGGATIIRFITDSGAFDSSITVSDITVTENGTSLTATLNVNGSAALGRRVVAISTAVGHSLTSDVGINTIEITAP